MTPLLIDLGAVPDCHCDSTLEHLFKAMAEEPDGDARSIWTPHDNPFLTAHVEDVTRRLSVLLERIQDALSRVLFGEPIGSLAKAAVPWMRWAPERFEQVRLELEAKRPETFTLDDWMMIADYLIQLYLPDGVINDEAEYLTVRAAILGKIQAAAGTATIPPDVMTAWATLAPTHFATVPPRMLAPVELETIAFAKCRAASYIGNVTETARLRMRLLVTEHVQAGVLGQKEGTAAILKTRLFDEFGQLNRDFRRIAVTEAGEACNQGFIAAQPLGSRVIRREAYRGACAFCRSINGKIFEVVAPDYPEREGAIHVWVGKSNVGRSASPNKREGVGLRERTPAERWWPAAGVQHPNCRGAWLPVMDAPPNVRPEFMVTMERMVQDHKARLDAANVAAELDRKG